MEGIRLLNKTQQNSLAKENFLVFSFEKDKLRLQMKNGHTFYPPELLKCLLDHIKKRTPVSLVITLFCP